ncbi:hypothetical protein HP931_001055 [Enterococcus faecalis]|nr:hypothetical protein [Enterococcus faecalis]
MNSSKNIVKQHNFEVSYSTYAHSEKLDIHFMTDNPTLSELKEVSF